ncbi:hypothetical protein [Vibrio phage vB_VhaM_VH-8]|nr:hypothetical protein [Vibrio phage vB_VhaM_VH-8]
MQQNIEVGSIWFDKSDEMPVIVLWNDKGEQRVGFEYLFIRNKNLVSTKSCSSVDFFLKSMETVVGYSHSNKEYVKGKTEGYNEGYHHGFELAKEKISELDEEERRTIYYEGYDSGHNQWQDDYGFTIPDNTVKNLEVTNYKKGLKDKASINEATRKHHYDMGYNDALAHTASEEAENRLKIKKQGFEDGYNTAIKEMKADKFNSGVCISNVPNKETQEAMQEVADKISYKGVWVSSENNPDWEIEYHSDCGAYLWVKIIKKPDMALGYTVGQLFTISKSALRERYSKKYVGDVNSKVEDKQLEKELELVEKYPHYYKDIRHLNIIDIYRFFDLFEVTDPCIQHSVKKLAVGGKRGAKDYEKDIKEAMDTLKRWEYMQEENKRGSDD